MKDELGGGNNCRVYWSIRPELSSKKGLNLKQKTVLNSCLPYAKISGITLVIENLYKDDFSEYPEFAQKESPVFTKLTSKSIFIIQIRSQITTPVNRVFLQEKILWIYCMMFERVSPCMQVDAFLKLWGDD